MPVETRNEASNVRRRALERELSRCIEALTRRDPPERVIVFGSLASDDVSEWSDLDLVVIRETALPFLERVKAVLELIQPQVGMDILVYTPGEFEQLCQERPFVRDEILGKGRTIYERNA